MKQAMSIRRIVALTVPMSRGKIDKALSRHLRLRLNFRTKSVFVTEEYGTERHSEVTTPKSVPQRKIGVLISAMWECGYLMLKRRPLSWTQTLYGLWMGLVSGLRGITLLVFVPLVRRFLRPRDTTLLIFALVSSTLGQFIFSAGTYDWVIFLCE